MKSVVTPESEGTGVAAEGEARREAMRGLPGWKPKLWSQRDSKE